MAKCRSNVGYKSWSYLYNECVCSYTNLCGFQHLQIHNIAEEVQEFSHHNFLCTIYCSHSGTYLHIDLLSKILWVSCHLQLNKRLTFFPVCSTLWNFHWWICIVCELDPMVLHSMLHENFFGSFPIGCLSRIGNIYSELSLAT